MLTRDNQVYIAAMRFNSNVDGSFVLPEALFYGYAKLLSMDESQVRNLVPEDCMDDLEAAHKWVSDKELDLNLIKSGLLLVIACIPDSKSTVSKMMMRDFLERKIVSNSPEILDWALQVATVPIRDIFHTGNDMQDVFNYIQNLKGENSAGQTRGGKKCQETSEESSDGVRVISLDEIITAERKRREKQGKSAEECIDDTFYTDEEDDAIYIDDDSSQLYELRNLGELAEKYSNLTATLLDTVKGQNQAVLKFVQGYNQGELLKQTELGNHPKSYFFFFGPPGVGKTLLAETAANALNIPYKIYNMSEYAGHDAYMELVGTPTIYGNSREGNLTKYVRNHPECLIIFDEIEKAHIRVLRLFLQILGSGRLQDACRGDIVSFSNVTIIFTSNVGRELYADRGINLTSLPEKVLVDSICNEKNVMGEPVLPPELCSRIASGNTVMFNHLTVRCLADMVRSNLDRVVADIKQEYGITVTYAKELPLLFLYNRGDEIDARIAVGQSSRFLKNEIYELMRQAENGKASLNSVRSIRIDVEWKGMNRELTSLFKNTEKSEILVLSDRKEIFASLDNDRYSVHIVTTCKEAMEYLDIDLAAVFIDPFLGSSKSNESILSITDYRTEGVKLFHNLVDIQAQLPIYILEVDNVFSEVDRLTFMQEGATGTVHMVTRYANSFKRQIVQIMDELYMERESQKFSQRGWVIDFNTKQELSTVDGKSRIIFYDLKKKMAVDVDSRSTILSETERPNVHFGDVIGAENAKEELKYFVNYLKNPKQFLMSGGKPPKGVLLYGPPGTGKTMLARAMAGESDVAFIQTSAAEFKNKYVGESEANVRKLFAKARKYSPAIIFIDEIDAIGKKRTGGDNSATTESILNTLLTEMDGFSSDNNHKKPVFVLAATNYGAGEEQDGIATLDDALIRRFDNKIYVDLPKESERYQYISQILKQDGIDTVSEDTMHNIAARTTGKSLAILHNVIELALRIAGKESHKMNDENLLNALEEYIYGEKREHSIDYYHEVAIHEVGHAVLSYLSGDKPSYITIESRGDYGGYMQHSNQEDVTNYTRDEILARIRTALAGRAAEQVFYGRAKSLNTGASSDLRQATDWVWSMLCSYGMDDGQLIVMSREEIMRSTLASEYVSKVNEILNREMSATVQIINNNRDKIAHIADILVKENRLTGSQFEEMMQEQDSE